MLSILDTEPMKQLLTIVEEATRSTAEGVKYFVEPGQGTLRRAISRRHHIVFGRRGSGKSSLMRKAGAELTVSRRPIAFVDLESFKGHSYPDVLLSVLISTLDEFKKWLDTAAIHPATKKAFWKRLFGKTPICPSYNKKKCASLSKKLEEHITDLRGQLHAANDAQLRVRREVEAEKASNLGGAMEISTPVVKASASKGGKEGLRRKDATTEGFRRSKIDFLHRHIIDYQHLFEEMVDLSNGDSYLFLDDLYHIKRKDQASLLDYFHRIAKGAGLWLKVGTVRHRSSWYIHGDPPTGMKLGDDAEDINLDLTLEKYGLAKDFLTRILLNFAQKVGISQLSEFLTGGALDRLVLASGGVARDFLTIFRRSVNVARERGGSSRGEKIGAEAVNVAAGEHDTSKREEFKLDASDDEKQLDEEFQKVTEFCLERANSNCFLLDKNAKGPEVDLIHELVDLKLLHLARSRVTVSGRKGMIFEAYMLDVSQYAGARKRRGLEIVEFWRRESEGRLRRAKMIYEI